VRTGCDALLRHQAFHRKLRECAISQRELGVLLSQFQTDCLAAAFRWLPLSPAVVARLSSVYARLPATVALRAADAIHLACAAEAGFGKVYSNDSRLLSATAHFGLSGANII
jgi:predicted nucleic acid-binding protein